ncbi:MAG: AEC family transporter, partial [Segetibacter sp.]
MDKVLLILFCITAGLLLRRFKILPENSYKTVNELLVNFFMPALILLQITELRFSNKYIFPILVAWIVFAVAFVFFVLVGKLKRFPPKTIAALIITGGISSTSFVGFPIFELLYGKEGLQIAILMSQAGSFLIGITLGVAVAAWHSSDAPSIKAVINNVFRFPPFIAFIVAVTLNISGIHFPKFIDDTLAIISAPFSVLALLSVGLQINLTGEDLEAPKLVVGLLYKLILAPGLIFLLYHFAFRQSMLITSISVMGAAIGPMNTAAIIAGKYNLNSKLASNMVAVGIPLSLP